MLTRIILFIIVGLYTVSIGSGIIHQFFDKKSNIEYTDLDSDKSDTEDSEESDEIANSIHHHTATGLLSNIRHAVWYIYSEDELCENYVMPELRPPDSSLFS